MLFGSSQGEMLQPGWYVRPMKRGDIPRVLDIIRKHDEDDGNWAAKTYVNRGVEAQWVLTENKRVAGVSGYAWAEDTHASCWISWTYLDVGSQGQGLGTSLLEYVLAALKQEGARKVFVTTSDYVDQGVAIYEPAGRLYESAGFRLEGTIRDYFEPGEAQLIYGLELQADLPPPLDFSGRDALPIMLTEPFQIDETEDCAAIDWDWASDGSPGFTAEDLALKLDQARQAGARSVFISFASDLSQALPPLQRCRFEEVARVKGFWANGVDDVRFRFDLPK